LVGVVTDRDVKRASASDVSLLDAHEQMYLVARIKVADIMSENPVTVSPTDTVEDTARILLDHGISGAPVVDESGALRGVITQKEIFSGLVRLTGADIPGVRFGFLLDDRPGSIKEVTDSIRTHGGRMVSILSSRDQAPPGKRFAWVHMSGVDDRDLEGLLAELSARVRVLYMTAITAQGRVFVENGKDMKPPPARPTASGA
ncbi:MAG: CBS domain-containing protein, partial [Pseudomonadota bacterium]